MSRLVATFPARDEFVKARARLDALALPYEVVSPDPGFSRVGAPSLVMTAEARRKLGGRVGDGFTASGWVEYRPAQVPVPRERPAEFEEDVFGHAAVMVLAPCVADATKIRLIAHLSGDLAEVFPYLNAVMREASYNVHGPTFTFLDRYRMVSMYPRRIAVAKADELVDAWRVLEAIRCRANEVWARRAEIAPSYEMRERPPALEILKRLPRTNCRACGEATCTAFAVKVWSGGADVTLCRPVFAGDRQDLKEALSEVCAGLGVGGGGFGETLATTERS
ncbi:MAG TPA: (Fe-S)-binding protein [Planctomycetota bacterium]|nr:(Fe-S)-binding protein [Planctomycetota bacterium]HRR82434.1 (Fe-S)-binding protein [Planctomycetota bacterium]HRT95704.1 (Fe-S)-binding protein [Planctomycetota bacterium]